MRLQRQLYGICLVRFLPRYIRLDCLCRLKIVQPLVHHELVIQKGQRIRYISQVQSVGIILNCVYNITKNPKHFYGLRSMSYTFSMLYCIEDGRS